MVCLKGKGAPGEGVRKTNNITVADEIMGSGKTFDAIEIMKFYNATGQKYIYVTPYRNEIKRVVKDVGDKSSTTPQITNQ
jgi:thymidine kinase